MSLFPGLDRLSTTAYSDARRAGQEREPALQHQPELTWYMDNYPSWRSLFNGTHLEETISVSQDPSSDSSDNEAYRWPVRYNLIHSYCTLHSGLLWGRGKTASQSDDLFEVYVDTKVPGKKEHTTSTGLRRHLPAKICSLDRQVARITRPSPQAWRAEAAAPCGAYRR